MYDENIPLPDEVVHDEMAGVHAVLAVQFEEPMNLKRNRSD